jgi:tetratricopeptide (TPR) repeat protein
MKHLRISCLASSLSILVGSLAVLTSSAVHAAECPATSPDRTEERRTLAKEWFARAEAAENTNDFVEAVRAYTCSMRMVAHAFTAYNLGRVAERSGDLELALKSYRAYLTLKADAPDKEEVQIKIKDLQAKVDEVKEGIGVLPTGDPEPVKPVEPVEPKPPKKVKPTPIEPPPFVEDRSSKGDSSHILEWVVGGAAVAALTTGIITNIVARNYMSTCNEQASVNNLKQARAACDNAPAYAYTSYVMFGIAGAAAAVEGYLLYRLWSPSESSSSSGTDVGLGWIPGGLALTASGRF